MNRSIQVSAWRWLLPVLLIIALAGCGGAGSGDSGKQAALLRAPAAGDHYAAELTYFSDADFEQHERVFGVMKIVAVDGDEITLVTENAGSTDRAVTTADLQGDLAAIEFDESERIIIGKADLQAAHGAGKIFGVRR